MVSDMYSSGYIVQTAMVRQLQFKQQQICANHASYASLQKMDHLQKTQSGSVHSGSQHARCLALAACSWSQIGSFKVKIWLANWQCANQKYSILTSNTHSSERAPLGRIL